MLGNKGFLIEVEGLDGSYKTTTVDILKTSLQAEYPGVNVVVFRQPGGTPIAEHLRNIVKNPKTLCENEHLFDISELHLLLAARAQLYLHCILPALSRGSIVILDRGNLSTVAYQSYSGLASNYIIESIVREPWFRKSDMLAILNTPYKVCKARIDARWEEEGLVAPDDHDLHQLAKYVTRTEYLDSETNEESTSTDYAMYITAGVSKLL